MTTKTAKILVPWEHFREVDTAIKNSGVKHYPYRKQHTSYLIEFEPADHPLVSFLLLKYDDTRAQIE